jgi:hypothetical protein
MSKMRDGSVPRVSGSGLGSHRDLMGFDRITEPRIRTSRRDGGTQDTALQIAWISSKLLVCSCRRPVTESVYDIEIGFSSGLALGFALQRLAAERVRTPGLRLRGENRRAPPQDMR